MNLEKGQIWEWKGHFNPGLYLLLHLEHNSVVLWKVLNLEHGLFCSASIRDHDDWQFIA